MTLGLPSLVSISVTLALVACDTPEPVPTQQVAAAEETFTGFTYLSSVRELAGGELLVADAGAKRVVVFDPRDSSIRQIGRQGEGPGEYRTVSTLWALRGDSTLMIDPIRKRWIRFLGSAVQDPVAPTDPAVRAVKMYGPFADSLGNVLTVQNGSEAKDSQVVLLVSRGSGVAENIAHLPPPVEGYAGAPPPYPIPGDHAALAPDGWLAILRTTPYRVDWRTPGGTWTWGEPIPIGRVRVDDEEKAFTIADMSEARRSLGTDNVTWPAFVPALVTVDLHFSPEGALVVERTPVSTDSGRVYDVINRQGHRTRQLVIPRNSRVIGFGRGHLYLAAEGADGFEALQIANWP